MTVIFLSAKSITIFIVMAIALIALVMAEILLIAKRKDKEDETKSQDNEGRDQNG